jgi:endonuclease/exonuclease/phosphatase (EEP) superfamily protein YafD
MAALACAAGLVGAVWGWADVLNNFLPVWLCEAWIGGLLARYLLPPGWFRAWAVIAAAFAVVVAGVPIALEASAAARETSNGPATLTLLTFNRWWDTTEPALQEAMIRKADADLVTLQEADGLGAVGTRLLDLYPFQATCGHCNTVILSKRPLLSRPPESAYRGTGWGSFLWARTTAPDGRPVVIATHHLFWPIPPRIQRIQRGHIADGLAPLPKDALILAGDFNLAPWTFGMRAWEKALAPLTRRTHGLLTFPATWPAPFLALDQVFAGPGWRTVSVERLPYAGSDHYPVLIRFARR